MTVMKKLLLVLGLLTVSYTANSQILLSLIFGDKLNSDGLEFGLDGGVNWTKIGNMDTRDYLFNWNLGFYFDVRIKNRLNLYTGVLVKSQMGAKSLTENDLKFLEATTYSEEGTYSQQYNYFLIPALLKYSFKFHMYVEGGPMLGWLYNSWIEFKSDVDGREAIVKEWNNSKTNWFDVGVAVGAGYRFLHGTGWTFGVRYYYGFINTYKGRSGSNNSGLFLKANVPVGVKKAQQKDALDEDAEIQEKPAKKKKKKSKKEKAG